MIVNMSDNATEPQIEHIIQRIREAGFQPHVTRGTERTIVAAVGSGGRRHEIEALSVAPGVDNVVAIAQPFKLVSRQTQPQPTVVNVGGVQIGGPEVVVIANFPLKSTGTDANVQVRGVSADALKVRKNVHISQGRFFEPGLSELVVGRNVARTYSGLNLGDTVSFGSGTWKVVGIFDAGGSAFDSEI